MGYYLAKLIITTLLVVLIAEISKRSSLIGSILASIPLMSVLAMTWLYIDTGDNEKVLELSTSIFWLVIPSLTLFISLPLLIKKGFGFYSSMAISIASTIIAYYLMILILGKFGIKL
ncbi:MAG: DUF3147 family protein [Sulfuricurvum sp.]|nr:DUF3147 family protein [Sulfuricurvum sp.]MDD5387465.1 DUF3147 family protein [Sulfuricurvum sp.]